EILSDMYMGRGNGFWESNPIVFRIWVTSASFAYISSPLTNMDPVITTPLVSATKRFNVFKSVVFPQPEGPMMDVIELFGIERLMFLRIRFLSMVTLRTLIGICGVDKLIKSCVSAVWMLVDACILRLLR